MSKVNITMLFCEEYNKNTQSIINVFDTISETNKERVKFELVIHTSVFSKIDKNFILTVERGKKFARLNSYKIHKDNNEIELYTHIYKIKNVRHTNKEDYVFSIYSFPGEESIESVDTDYIIEHGTLESKTVLRMS